MRWIWLPWLVAACGAPASTSPCPELTEALCRGNVDCCDQPERRSADVASCMEENLALCERVIGDAARGDGVVYDPAPVAALTDLVDERAARCEPVPDLGLDALLGRGTDAPEVGLALAIRGAVPAGEACGLEGQSSLACEAGTSCLREGSGLGGLGPGTCEPIESGAVGESCASLGPSTCQGGAVCASCADFPDLDGCADPTAIGAGVCVVEGTEGQECGPATCGPDLWCEGWGAGSTGACAPAKADGEACEGFGGECASGHCEDGTCGRQPPGRTHCAVWRGRIG